MNYLLIWIAVSFVISPVVGSIMAFGRGQESRQRECAQATVKRAA